jgi:hypothetical protein
MDENRKGNAVTLRTMLLILFVGMAAAIGVAYLLVYPFFHR